MSKAESESEESGYSEKLIDELLKAVEEMETRERWMYLPFTQLPDPKIRRTILLYVRKIADQTENYAQGWARNAEKYGIMMTIASMQKPIQDGIIVVLKFQVVGVRGDILKAYYRSLKRFVKSVKEYKSSGEEESIGEEIESGAEPRTRPSIASDNTTTSSKEAEAESHSEEHNDTGSDTSSYSEDSGRVIVL